MQKFNLNHALTLTAIIVMMILAAVSGYRLEVGSHGLTFERGPLPYTAEVTARP